MDFLGDSNTSSALDVIFFVREIMETNPSLRDTIRARLLDSFSQIRSSRVCSCALWIIGEYCVTKADILQAYEVGGNWKCRPGKVFLGRLSTFWALRLCQQGGGDQIVSLLLVAIDPMDS